MIWRLIRNTQIFGGVEVSIYLGLLFTMEVELDSENAVGFYAPIFAWSNLHECWEEWDDADELSNSWRKELVL